MYSLEFSKKAKIFLKKSDEQISTRILDRLENLKENPVPKDSKFIGREDGDKIFRYRIGDYRALYLVDKNKGCILVLKIDKRPRVYK